MEKLPRDQFGMVRTSRAEFESLAEDAWWMHEQCMEKSDLRSYFGGEKELKQAIAAADAQSAGQDKPSSGAPAASKKTSDPLEDAKAEVKAMSVKELKAYLTRNKVSIESCVEKTDLLNKALEVVAEKPPIPKGPAWMPPSMVCRLCAKPPGKEQGGVICRRLRADGSVSGCGEGVCWRCMKRAPRESFGQVRTTKEEFESLEADAWWMHEGCFQDGDYKDYFGESEPEEFYNRRTKADQDWAWEDPMTAGRPTMGDFGNKKMW
mmetsp:Transcript_81016/g.177883  ORF Transcript_81016/g.177883 Transcript_81016/m.177883 type:complete len:264 (+) Transcript_81016:606-1397(+)